LYFYGVGNLYVWYICGIILLYGGILVRKVISRWCVRLFREQGTHGDICDILKVISFRWLQHNANVAVITATLHKLGILWGFRPLSGTQIILYRSNLIG